MWSWAFLLAAVFATVAHVAGAQETESNDSAGSANEIMTDGTPMSAAIGVVGDVDWFFFSATVGETYTITTVTTQPQERQG